MSRADDKKREAELAALQQSLLPCPFCAGPATLKTMPGKPYLSRVLCDNILCGGHTPPDAIAEDSVTKWNRRDAPTAQPSNGALRCPFCGGWGERHRMPDVAEKSQWSRVTCRGCGCTTWAMDHPNAALRAWNLRGGHGQE